MTSNTIIRKLNILSYLPMLVIFIGIVFFSIYSYDILKNLSHLKTDVKESKNIALLINELQRERGLSIGFLSSKGTNYRLEIIKQRAKVDAIYPKVKKSNIRFNIDHFTITDIELFEYYTKEIRLLLKKYIYMTLKVKNSEVKDNLQAYISLSIMKESLGQMRGALNGILSTDNKVINKKLYYKLTHAKGIYDTSKCRFNSTASENILYYFHTIISTESYHWIEKMISKYTRDYTIEITNNSQIWWNKITKEINKFYSLENDYFLFIETYVDSEYKKIILNLIINSLLFIFLMIIILFLSYRIKERILKNIKLLNEYRDAVDRSSIVSKTDKHGVITYVNHKFCSISGYDSLELLGKSHNIIRHPDMPKSAFKDLWEKISKKEAWSGIVKNKKKDGGYYIVEATINPILNHKGEVEEYIAIRNDITQSIQLKNELEDAQKDLIYRLGEITEVRSEETGYHVQRVAKYSELLAKYYGLNDEIKYLILASSMHDIGKVAIPDAILNKEGKLTNDEWEIMKTHTQIGYDLFKNSDKPLLEAAAVIAYEHHEKYDGTGYPRGLKGNAIHIFARITSLADVFDALGSDRSYKKAWKDDEIFTFIQNEKGKSFDPKLVDIFFVHIDEFLKIREQYNRLD